MYRGCVVEAGCAYGATTAYLNKFMTSKQPPIQRDYFAIDTFSGFLHHHSSYEISKRGQRFSVPSSRTIARIGSIVACASSVFETCARSRKTSQNLISDQSAGSHSA